MNSTEVNCFDSSEEWIEIRKRLEWELSLNWTDIRSNGWFHGSINRSSAEHLLQSEGQFLVRECSSRTNDYVLSCLHCGHHLHFVISKVILQPNTVYERIQYSFEDECFDTITDLITFYVGNKRPISLASNAVITTPVNRTQPLTKTKTNSTEDHTIGCCPPPKPSRIPVKPYEHSFSNEFIEQNNGQESDPNRSHESEDSAFFSDSISDSISDSKQISIENINISHHSDQRTYHSLNSMNSIIKTNELKQILTIPPEISSSLIRVQSFQTYLLPKDNKPLESTAITKIQSVLCDTGARILANHLTKCDLQFIKHLGQRHDFGLGIVSALELMLLPHGQHIRSDLIDRHQCLKYFVAITLLTANSDTTRLIILNKWIEIAIETKTALGDLFGFAAIMEGLSMSPICHLKKMWAFLRKDYTQNAITFETKLRPQLKCMTECNEPQAPNTSFPFIISLLQILQRDSIVGCHENQINKTHNKFELIEFGFEQTAVDYGLQQIHNHLEQALQMMDQLNNYRRNGQIVLDGCQYEELLSDMFCTEFHLKFLFGFRGSLSNGYERFDKLDQIVMALALKCEPDIDLD